MNGINLLPWREQLRDQKKQLFIMAIISCLIAPVFFIIIYHIIIVWCLSNQLQDNAYLNKVIHTYDRQVQELKELKLKINQYIIRMQLIRNLQMHRQKMVHLFNELAFILPDGIYFYAIKSEDNKITIMGKAESNLCISKFMRNIANAKCITEPILKEIKVDHAEPDYSKIFQLQCLQKSVGE
ncbi:type 4a pilus biogenesis protein PilN [soil metagenome]